MKAGVCGVLRRTLAQMGRERSGSVAIMVAFGTIALVGCVGIAVDTSLAYAVKSRLGAAVDAAALAGARAFASPSRDQDIENFFNANFPAGYLGSTVQPLEIVADPQENKVHVTARVTIPTYFMRVLGAYRTDIAASAEATLSSRDVEVSLVLDVTGSMNLNNRLTNLKPAAKELIDIVVQDVQQPFFSKVAIIPYSMGVNVGSLADQVRGSVTSGTCTYPAPPTCARYEFPRMGGGTRTQDISTCVTERPGPHLYTDESPSLAQLGKNYPTTNNHNPCLGPKIIPLSSDKEALKSAIENLQAGGSTAGHVGVAWGWYLLSPNFAYLLPVESQPVSYTHINLGRKVLKVVIIMTDGEFNTVYQNGVVARNSLNPGSGENQYKIAEDATHGSSYDQANALCDAIKAEGVEIYTVGLEVHDTPAAQNFVNNCATSPEHVYLPNTGTELKAAFRDIAAQVSNLRISQ